jgi:hypothetical protein
MKPGIFIRGQFKGLGSKPRLNKSTGEQTYQRFIVISYGRTTDEFGVMREYAKHIQLHDSDLIEYYVSHEKELIGHYVEVPVVARAIQSQKGPFLVAFQPAKTQLILLDEDLIEDQNEIPTEDLS